MADVKFSGLPAASSVAAADLVCISQGGTSKKAAADLLVNDAPFSGSSWNGDIDTAPSRNAVYDQMHLFDTDDDGKINVLDTGAGIVKTDSSGVVGTAAAGTDYQSPISATSPVQYAANVVSLNVGTDFAFTAPQTITETGGLNSNATQPLTLRGAFTGTGGAANGFGTSIGLLADSDTVDNRNIGTLICAWSTVTDATRTSYMDFQAVNSNTLASRMRLFGSGGLSVNSTTDPGAGYVNANTGFKIAGTSILPVTPTNGGLPTGGIALQILEKNTSTNYDASWVTGIGTNASTNVTLGQQISGANDTYLNGSTITIAAGDVTAGTVFHCLMHVSKTGAGTAAVVFIFRGGTLGTTSDAVIITSTLPAGTGVVDTGYLDFYARFVAIGATGKIDAMTLFGHNLSTTGLWSTGTFNTGTGGIIANASFNTTAVTKLGISYNPGTLGVHNVTVFKTELFRP